jgi:hypothetical protein
MVVALNIIGIAVMPNLLRSREVANGAAAHVTCKHNLMRIALSLRIYANEHDGPSPRYLNSQDA